MLRKSMKQEIDMVNGPILRNMVRFSVPLMLSTVLQLLYNAADMVVAGRYAGSQALAAVGATGAISSLLVTLFMGLSVGTSVSVAQNYGAERHRDVSESVHTSVLLALTGGIIIGIAGILLARPLLRMMDTPSDILDQSVLYMSIYFVGMPMNLLYNFSAAVLNAIGDTRRPMFFLAFSGIINVLLNLLFVIAFHMGVAGVALATILSQTVSMVLVIQCLMRSDGSIQLNLRKLRFHKDKVIQILRIGLPAGLQNSMFSIANTLIQSAFNGFGSTILAAKTAASSIECFVSMPLCAFYSAAMSFASQCFGAQKLHRIKPIARAGAGMITLLGIVIGLAVAACGRPLMGIYTTDPEVMKWGSIQLWMLATTCFIADSGEVFVSCMRATGNSVQPMILSLLCTCVFRVIWICTIFRIFPTIYVLYLVYPVSWTLATVVHWFCYRRHMNKLLATHPA